MKRRETKQAQWILHRYYKRESQLRLNSGEVAVAAQHFGLCGLCVETF